MEDVKQITILQPLHGDVCDYKRNRGTSAVVSLTKPKKSRIVTDTKRWIHFILDAEKQEGRLEPLEPLCSEEVPPPRVSSSLYNKEVQWKYVQEAAKNELVEHQIKRKLQGYKAQDMEKHLWNVDLFVHYAYVLQLLVQCELSCVYCRNPTMVLYEYVREPKQWTLERIDNSLGHICGNVQIACLTCNLRRRTMKQERYLLTKQMMHVVKLNDASEESI